MFWRHSRIFLSIYIHIKFPNSSDTVLWRNYQVMCLSHWVGVTEVCKSICLQDEGDGRDQIRFARRWKVAGHYQNYDVVLRNDKQVHYSPVDSWCQNDGPKISFRSVLHIAGCAFCILRRIRHRLTYRMHWFVLTLTICSSCRFISY